MPDERSRSKLPRFTLRTALCLMAFATILMGLYASNQRLRASNQRLLASIAKVSQRLDNAHLQISLDRSRSTMPDHKDNANAPKLSGVCSFAKLEGVNLRDVAIAGGTNAFYQSVFDRSDLTNAALTGGPSSFQGTSFNNTILKNAQLIGGVSSFQFASFQHADLSGAVLNGNLQGVILADAKCVGATIIGSFQVADISNAQFQDADLSGIASHDLESCHFEPPPQYNGNTKLPNGFDPVATGWKIASQKPSPK